MAKPTKTLTVRLAPQFCPVCFTLLDAATNMQDDKPPEEGDFTICVKCRSVLRYGQGMALVASSLMEIPVHSRFMFAKVLRLMEQYPPPK